MIIYENQNVTVVKNGNNIVKTKKEVSDYNKKLLKNEVYILNKLVNYDFVPKVVSYDLDKCSIELSYFEGHNLKEYDYRNKSKNEIIDLFIEICKKYKILHEIGIIHNDVKPTNILFKNNQIYIIDFENSLVTNNNHFKGTVSYRYSSPELLNLEDNINNQSDIYSIGVMLYQFLNNFKYPFDGTPEEITKLKNEEIYIKTSDDMMNEIYIKCFKVNLNERYKNIDELMENLKKAKEENKMIKEEKFLPIGTVVLLQNGTKKVMVNGYCPLSDGKLYDYSGVLYPEGVVDPTKSLLFNHSQIGQVFYMGYQDEEQKTFFTKLNEVAERVNKGESLEDIAKSENVKLN